MDETAAFLKEITSAAGVPGYEAEVRAVIRRHLPAGVAVQQDNMGSIICAKKGASDTPRVMLAGHMDEIGFMVKMITKEGFIRFLPLGGWFDQVLLGQRVIIKTTNGDVLGVLGCKPPHLLGDDERKKVIDKRDMYIDIGATCEDDVVKAGVRIGDPVIPLSEFAVLSDPKVYLAKAWDDRIGCALFVETIQRLTGVAHPNTVFGVGTTQEEVGLRGAKTSAYAVNPDVAIILESDIAGDVPGIKPEESSVKMGKGPTLLVYDARMIPNLKLRDLVMSTAKENGIPLQISIIERGATDGGMIHMHNAGVPTVVIAVPARHIHSHGGIIHRDDYDNALKLLVALVQKLDSQTVASLTA